MAGSSGYTSSEIMTMQKDAIRRVNEMQRLAKEKVRETQNDLPQRHRPEASSQKSPYGFFTPNPHAPAEKFSQAPSPQPPPPPPSASLPTLQTEVVPNLFQGFLEKLHLDSESLMLIMMILLLVNEGADTSLLAALVYILL